MRRVNVEDEDYAVLERYARSMGSTVDCAVVLAVEFYRKSEQQMEIVAVLPPELYSNPEVTEEEALAIESRWVHDNGLMGKREALELLEISRLTLDRYEKVGLLDGIKVYRGHTYKRQYWYSAENLWQITQMRSRQHLISAARCARILEKIQRVSAIQRASRDISDLKKEK